MEKEINLSIPISQESRLKLIKTWGPEVILRCSCGDRPSHSMWGQYGSGKCPICKETCEMIPYQWGLNKNGP